MQLNMFYSFQSSSFTGINSIIRRSTNSFNSINSFQLYDIKSNLMDDMKASMKSKDSNRLAAVKAMRASIKQKEVDERIDVDDNMAIEIFTKMVKQRKDSISSYQEANRLDLVESEQNEINVIMEYMPKQLNDDEIKIIINDAISTIGATSIKDMGKVMGIVKDKIAGKADAGAVGKIIKDILNSK